MNSKQTISEEQSAYFDLLAEIGHTKHIGGMTATARLIELIDPRAGEEVLDVGCGVGIGAVFLASHFRCRVLGVDITPRMLERAQERAARHEVSELTEFRTGDMHDLPFASNRFDAAMAESVLTFSVDKVAVINELARVVRPGGMVAFTEAIWVRLPPADQRDFMARAGGMPDGIWSHAQWQEALVESALADIVAEAQPITAREEAASQRGRVGAASYLRAIPGFLRALAQARYRKVIGSAAGSLPKDYFTYIGYGVYGGRVVD